MADTAAVNSILTVIGEGDEKALKKFTEKFLS
jgi:hypothetical protein